MSPTAPSSPGDSAGVAAGPRVRISFRALLVLFALELAWFAWLLTDDLGLLVLWLAALVVLIVVLPAVLVSLTGRLAG